MSENKDTIFTYPEGFQEFLSTLTHIPEGQRESYVEAMLKLIVNT